MKTQMLLRSFFAFTFFSLLAVNGMAQTQIGADIDGESGNDRSGYSVSMGSDETVAIGAILNDGGGSNSGHVRVYDWDGSAWGQRGSDINGESSNDNSGISVSMPHEDFVGIGAYRNDDNGGNSGQVRIYRWDGSAWVQRGNDIDGEAGGDESGRNISMPDTNTVAIGARNNDGNGSNAGHVRVYSWNGSAWVQKGSDLDGPAADYEYGRAVSMPDSNTLAVSALGNIFEPGEVYIYDWNGTNWVQRGSTIVGEATFDESGFSLSMPSPNYVAIGAPNNQGNGSQAGHVRIYEWNGVNWVQVGSDIDGEAANDRCGASVSMPDSVTIAVGANWNQTSGTFAGHTRIFRWNGSAWIQDGIDIDAQAADDQSGYSVDMPSDKTVAIGAFGHDGLRGNTRIFSLCESNTVDVVNACGSYLWIDGITYTASNNMATWVLTNAAGCDSTITLDLTINQSSSATDVITACDSYFWIDGNTYTSSNNSATHVIPNAAGCDSTITLDLTINTSTAGTDVITACDSYLWIDGNTYTSSNNTATHVIPNVVGCDSTITLDLTINTSTTGTDVITTCDSYLWIDGNTYTSSNNTATHVIPNAAGCDSTITLDLTINTSTTGTDVITTCDSYLWIDGNTYTSSNNTATHVIPNAAGCDSTITLDLTINTSTTGTEVITTCDSYLWIDGNTYTSSNNTATYVIPNAAGCDSIITLDLTVNTSTTGTGVITACDSYLWIDGNTYTSSNNTATHVIPNAAGCDSIITLDLTINTSTTGTDVITACDSYLWIDGNTYTSSNNTATYVIPNAAGCDSIITLDLTVNTSTTGTDVITACDSYLWIDGNTYTSSNNTATHVIPNSVGCDSTITLDLTINTSTTGTDVIIACDSYLWIDGNTYTSSNNTATHVIPNAAGCDSVITLDLAINSVSDLSTSVSGITISANNTNATYVWLDCDDNFAVISGETNQSFVPSDNGNYAIELTENGCVDTTACVAIATVGVTELTFEKEFVLMPNPGSGQFEIDLGSDFGNVSITVTNVHGSVVAKLNAMATDSVQMEIKEPTGVYFVQVIADNQSQVLQLIIK